MDWMTILFVVTAVVSSASLALHAIAPLTATKADDKVMGWLDWVVEILKKLSLNKSGV